MQKFNVEGGAVKNKLHSINGGMGGTYTPQHNIVSDIILLVITSKNKFLEISD